MLYNMYHYKQLVKILTSTRLYYYLTGNHGNVITGLAGFGANGRQGLLTGGLPPLVMPLGGGGEKNDTFPSTQHIGGGGGSFPGTPASKAYARIL